MKTYNINNILIGIKMKRINILLIVAAFPMGNFAAASELLYRPINPSFGGNPNNSTHLFSLANTQNQFLPGREQLTPLEEFNERLQRALLGRISSAVSQDIVDGDGNIVPGVFETLDYTINITDLGGGVMRIDTTDKATGNVTTIEVRNDIDPL